MARVSSNSFVSVGLAIMIGGGLYTAGVRVTSWEKKLEEFDRKLSDRWTYSMDRESWLEAQRLNPGLIAPNHSAIRDNHTIGANGVLQHPESVALPDSRFDGVN